MTESRVYLIVTPAQLQAGWVERLPDGSIVEHPFHVVGRTPAGNYVVHDPQLTEDRP